MRRVALVIVVAATVAGGGGAQPAPTGCCYLSSLPREWSADGARLYLHSNLASLDRPARYETFVMNADGTGLAPVLPDRPDGQYLRTPDGRRVAFLARDDVLYSIDENGVEQNVIATGVSRDGSVSPDGRRYAYSVAASLKLAFTSISRSRGGGYAASASASTRCSRPTARSWRSRTTPR